MNTTRRHSLRRLAGSRRRGQSIPIIALMIVILVAMVGLSVDVGNTFSKERQAVSATNSASIAGMTAYINRSAGTTDQSIYDAIADTIRANGMEPGDGSSGTLDVKAYYLNAQGELLADHPVVGSGGTAPNGVGFIQVVVNGLVDTSFARVVGRPDLPINATAHAGLCPVNSGVYPLAVDTTYITGNKFNDVEIDKTNQAQYNQEYKVLSNGNVQRRIYVKDTGPGNFSYLRWMEDEGVNGRNATSAYELANSLAGDGNIAQGFEEAPWPAGETAPQGYPEDPGRLNAGDWVWGTSGWKENNGSGKDGVTVGAALHNHIANGTRMILPIYSDIRGTGSNIQFRIVRLGVFVLVDQGKEPSRGPYFDMVFLGEPVKQYTACSVTPPPPASNNLELFGNVSFFPEYQITPNDQKPIQYVVVLDASGSMSANFNGQCNNNGLVQCANGPAGYPAVQVGGTGPDYYWTTESERRIYVAKKALERLVRLSNMPGNSGYTNTRPDDQMAVVWYNHVVSANNTQGFSSNPDNIVSFITGLNKTRGDNYRSEGGTNGAAGLYRASLLYGSAPKTVFFNGKDVEYKRVVLFITDGVSNQFLNINSGNLGGGVSGADTYPSGSYCRSLGGLVNENAECQTTDGANGSKWNGWDRPITQMINASQQYLRNTSVNAQVFAIALSNIPSTGLRDGIPSSSSYFFQAEGLEKYSDGTTNVDGIIDLINAAVEHGECVPGPSGSSTGSITSDQFVNGTGGFTYPQVGLVTISNETESLTAPIKADSNGNLSYFFPSVPQGTYRLTAYLYYHHPLDQPGVMRMYSKIWSTGQALNDYTVDVSPSTQGSSFSERIDQPLTLKLNGNVCGATL